MHINYETLSMAFDSNSPKRLRTTENYCILSKRKLNDKENVVLVLDRLYIDKQLYVIPYCEADESQTVTYLFGDFNGTTADKPDYFDIETHEHEQDFAELIQKRKSTNKKPKGDKPWFNEECRFERQNYRKLKRKLKFRKTDTLKREVSEAEKRYKNTLDANSKKYRKQMRSKLKYMKTSDPKEYWNLLNRGKQKKQPNLPLEDLFDFFKKLNQTVEEPPNREMSNTDIFDNVIYVCVANMSESNNKLSLNIKLIDEVDTIICERKITGVYLIKEDTVNHKKVARLIPDDVDHESDKTIIIKDGMDKKILTVVDVKMNCINTALNIYSPIGLLLGTVKERKCKRKADFEICTGNQDVLCLLKLESTSDLSITIKHKNGKDVVATVSSSYVQNKKVMYSIRCKYLDTNVVANLLKS
ncbi:unnamed protein product [Mytilus edulis]|uniref:Uncharacterized protein n=1 Tax=Mytilus edulis TaxID=6550 RepID=A0A8S3V7U3_MYTED|nr:unnamed protein product [Mytilus edulis]